MSTTLSEWHERLDGHFRVLRSERDAFGQGRPLFALEHGLDLGRDLEDLSAAVRASVAEGQLPQRSWLPFVVYAAEIGYRYQGDEYWPVFEAETPRWKQRGSGGRLYVRRRYEEFAETYGGALPSGRWAAWFKNIAWPITHAVLPTDLQRHLARLLYDYRRALTNDLLDDHDALGERLARRSHDTSARFRQFAENSQLLGLVAASLLLGDEESSALLDKATLHRIVVDLSHERQAGAWLRDAKRAAVRVRRRGFVAPSRSPIAGPSLDSDVMRWPKLELDLSVRRAGDGWRAYVAVPGHESLAQRFPDLRGELEKVRYRVAGVEGTQPRGALMYRRGPLPLIEWPASQAPVIAIEGGSEALKELLVDHCRMPAGPWLFHLNEPGLGREVRTNSVRPGEQYLLLTCDHPQLFDASPWEQATLSTSGVSALSLDVPAAVDAAGIEALQLLGVGLTSGLEVWPAGLVPAGWDGEGRATWLAGEDPIIGVRSSRSATTCVVSTEVEIVNVPWPDGDDNMFVQLSDLSAGSHRVDVALLDPDVDGPIAEGQLILRILEPADSSSTVGARQGLQVLSHPARPSLEELWTGEAAIVADGPEGEKVQFSVSLMTRSGRQTLARAAFSSALPVDALRWDGLFRGAKGTGEFKDVYDDAEEMVVTASSLVLGETEIRAQRPFASLRWCVGSDRDGPFARLIDHLDSDDLVVTYFDVAQPAAPTAPSIDGDDRIRTVNGGLIVATSGELSASAVLPPHISGGLESLDRLRVRPSLQTGTRSSDSVRKMIDLARLWARAATSGGSYAEALQARVNGAIVARLGGMIGGERWWEIELDVLDGRRPLDQRLVDGVGRFPEDRRVALALVQIGRTVGRSTFARSAAFANLLNTHTAGRYTDLADPILHLATAPGGLDAEDALVVRAVAEVLQRPVSYRLARLYALVVATPSDGADPDSASGGWSWES